MKKLKIAIILVSLPKATTFKPPIYKLIFINSKKFNKRFEFVKIVNSKFMAIYVNTFTKAEQIFVYFF